MTIIKAAVCHAFGEPLRVEDIHLRAPLTGEVEVSIDAVAICHSDISFMEGIWGGSLPAVYGHEAAGRVTKVGEGVQTLKEGDSVIVTLVRSCGACASCAGGSPVSCTTPYDGDAGPITMPDGSKLHQAMATGGFAEKVVVDQRQVVAVSPNISKEAAALVACGVITGVGAVVNSAQLRAGQDVVVIGAGGVGLNAIQGARIAGARRIVAVDMSAEKLDTAKEFGATHSVLASHKAPWLAAHKALGGRGADAVIVTVGAIPAYDQAPNYLAAGGKVIMVGMPHVGGESTYEPVNFAASGQGMVGSKMGDVVIQRDIPWLVDLYDQGRLKLDELISGRWPLEQINEAIADTKSGSARRNVIVFPPK